ncbi:hypothetical protein D3C71_1806940 [compost metagenome]
MAQLDDDLHAGQEDPLQPLLKTEGIHGERHRTGQCLVAWRLVIPPALHLQLALDQEQVVGNIQHALLDHHELTRAFCRASAAPALSPCFSRAWAIVFQSSACRLGRPLA